MAEALSIASANGALQTLREMQFRLELQMCWIAGAGASTKDIARKLGLAQAAISQDVLDAIADGFARTAEDTDADGRKLLIPGPLARARIHQWAELILRFTEEHYPNEVDVTFANVSASLREVDAMQRVS